MIGTDQTIVTIAKMHVSESRFPSQYSITHSMWRHDYKVTGPQHFHVDNSTFRPGKPDLTFHAGSDTTAPIAAVCKFHNFSANTDIGLADPNQANEMNWVCMSRQGLVKMQYGFPMDVGDHRPHHFTWKSTQSMGTGRTGNLKLVDGSTQEVVAVFSSSSSFSKRKTGSLDIYVDYGERFQLLVLSTGLAVREKLRRASNAASASAASGGAAAPAGGGGC